MIVQVDKQLPESRDVCTWIGMDHAHLDMAGDERHDITAHHKRGTIIAEGSLGFIAVDKRIVGPVCSMWIRVRWARSGSASNPLWWKHNIRILANNLALLAYLRLMPRKASRDTGCHRGARGRCQVQRLNKPQQTNTSKAT